MKRAVGILACILSACVPQGGGPVTLPSSPASTASPSASPTPPVAIPTPSPLVASPSPEPSPTLAPLSWGRGEVIAGNGQGGDWIKEPYKALEVGVPDMPYFLALADGSLRFVETNYDRLSRLSGPLNPTGELDDPYRILTKLVDVESPTGLVPWETGWAVASRLKNQILYISDKWETTVLAGNGMPKFAGDGGKGTSGSLYDPYGLSLGPDGSLYWAELNNHVIRRLLPDGTLATVAGTGERGESSTKLGAADAVQLVSPLETAVGPDGTVYFLMDEDQRIFQVKEGVVSVAAGTGVKGFKDDKALLAHFNTPTKLRFGPDGLLYVSDSGNHRIRRLNANGTVTTVVGTGDGDGELDDRKPLDTDLGEPEGLNFGPDGSLYVYSGAARQLIYFAVAD